MNTDWKDYLFSSIVLLTSILTAFICSFSMHYLTNTSPPNQYQPIIVFIIGVFLFGTTCIAQARIILKLHPFIKGSYAMSDSIFRYWKIYSVLYYFGCGALKPFTVMFLKPLVQALYGAKIGKNVALGGTLVDPHMISIGSQAIIGEGSILTGHAITSGRIIFAPILIEENATVGVNAVVMPGVIIKKRAILLAGAVATLNTIIPEDQIWGGIPARPIKQHTT